MTRTAHFYLKIFTITIVAILIISYGYYQSRNYLAGAELAIESPQNGSTATTSLVVIEGHARNISRITLNDRGIFVDESGLFREKVLLSPGYNIFKVEVEDKFKRKKEAILELVYKE